MKSTFRLALIIYLAVFLTGVPLALTGYAKITPTAPVDEQKLITIQKGDTLWDLAAKHINPDKPWLWTEFKKYNAFTDPHWIYPGEKLQLPDTIIMSEGGARKVVDMGMSDVDPLTKEELENIKKELAAQGMKLDSAAAEISALKTQLQGLSDQARRIQSDLDAIRQMRPDTTSGLDKLNAAMAEQAEANRAALTRVNGRIDELQKEINRLGDAQSAQGNDLRALNTSADAMSMKLTDSQDSINALKADIAKLQEAVDGLKAETGDWETPTKSKRTIAILAALAGGVAFFVANAIGASD